MPSRHLTWQMPDPLRNTAKNSTRLGSRPRSLVHTDRRSSTVGQRPKLEGSSVGSAAFPNVMVSARRARDSRNADM